MVERLGEEAAGRKNFEGGVPYSTEPYEEWRKTMDYRTHMHADYERAAAKQKEARDFAGGKVTPLHNNTPWTTPVEYSEDAEWTNYPGMTRAELINMRDWTARQLHFDPPVNGYSFLRGDDLPDGHDPSYNNPRWDRAAEYMTFRDEWGDLHVFTREELSQYKQREKPERVSAHTVPREYIQGKALAVFLPIPPFAPVWRIGWIH